MTTTLGSVDRKPGHIKVSTANLWPHPISNWDHLSWRLARPMIEVGCLYPVPYRFCIYGGKIYYVNGRKQIYETDIVSVVNVLFNPVGYQMLDDLSWHPIQFRLLEKVEWVFL
jgi:hypothetical protein